MDVLEWLLGAVAFLGTAVPLVVLGIASAEQRDLRGPLYFLQAYTMGCGIALEVYHLTRFPSAALGLAFMYWSACALAARLQVKPTAAPPGGDA